MPDTPTPKQRMLNAYRGLSNDRPAVAPEFWVYYPAKLLGVDIIQFEREVPFHLALKTTFESFDCDGWGIASPHIPNPDVEGSSEQRWVSDARLQTETTFRTSRGDLHYTTLSDREEPSWVLERPVKDLVRDLPAFEILNLPDPSGLDPRPLLDAWQQVGESYLLEAFVGVPFFDFFAGSLEGGFEAGIYALAEHADLLEGLRERYIEHLVRKTAAICERTPVESLFIGCSWSCNSLLGPRLWRQWDKPVIAAVADEVHRHGRLLHVHLHGACMETLPDIPELGIDCVCPFERPPGGDVEGLTGLQEVARVLDGVTTMNGNVHTVETLIRGDEAAVRAEVQEILQAFDGNPRLIVGTGDQVGRETPEENLRAMIDEAKTGA